jgi:hypothetical protein
VERRSALRRYVKQLEAVLIRIFGLRERSFGSANLLFSAHSPAMNLENAVR